MAVEGLNLHPLIKSLTVICVLSRRNVRRTHGTTRQQRTQRSEAELGRHENPRRRWRNIQWTPEQTFREEVMIPSWIGVKLRGRLEEICTDDGGLRGSERARHILISDQRDGG